MLNYYYSTQAKRLVKVWNKIDKKIRLEVKWRYTKEPSISFKHLMMLLLKERNGNGEKTQRESKRPNYQML